MTKVDNLVAAASSSKDFLEAYFKACETAKSVDWMDAALLAKQWECRVTAALAEMEKVDE